MKEDLRQQKIAKSIEVKEHPNVMQLILIAAENNPKHLAICTSNRQYCYRDLLVYIESAVEDLLSNSVAKGDVIGLHGECSFEFIGYFLACLSIGAVSIFIDEDLPETRKALMLKHANARTLINFSNDMESLHENELKPKASINGIKYIKLQAHIKELQFHDPAYIFSTSGSTGVPKGVVGCHGGLSHFIHWQSKEFNIGSQDKVAQISALSFDVVLREILLPLLSGATLWIPLENESLYPKKTIEWIVEKEITIVHTVPTMLRTWLPVNEKPTYLNKLRYLFSAGEPLLASVVESWRHQFGSSTEIINLYGPTETTLAKCFYRLPAKLSKGVQPIGKPIGGAEIFIMTSDQRICDQGEKGEIVIRTPYRSLGYVNSTQTRRVFKRNKYSKDQDDLLYFTGDLGFVDGVGRLRILGRNDNQVKVNGVRIELGEIEKNLYYHKGVLHAAALVYDKCEIKTLIAVVSLKKSTTTGELVNHLQKLLPQTHIPSRIMIVESMPLTASGKVNKSELLTLFEKEARTSVAPSYEEFTEVEHKLYNIWKRIISVDGFGLDDHIMTLGCSSIEVISIANSVFDEFGILVNYKTLMKYPTVRLFGQFVAKKKLKREQKPTVKANFISLNNRNDSYPLSASQKRFWLMSKNKFIPSQLYNVYAAFRLQGSVDVERLKVSVDSLVARHSIFQIVIKENNFEPRQCLGTTCPCLEVLNLDADQNMDAIIQEYLSTAINLGHGPLTKFYLFVSHNNMMTFVVNQHHIISDDISLGELISELSDIYNGVQRCDSEHKQDFIQYIEYESQLASDDESVCFSYWKKHLAGHVDLSLPYEHSRPPVFNYHGQQLIYRLDGSIEKCISSLSKQLKYSEFTVLFSAFYILLSHYSGRGDFVIGVPVSNRPSSSWEGALGCFVNMLAIKPKADQTVSLKSLLKRINEDVINGYENQNFSFDKIIDALNIQHDQSHTPLYQVIFNMQPRLIYDALHLDGIDSSYIEIANSTTKTDLTWAIKKDNQGCYLCIDYATSLFSEAGIKQLAKSYETLLKSLYDNLDQSIDGFSLLSDEEKNNYFSSFESTYHQYEDKYDYLYSPFEQQAQRNPEKIAIKAHDGLFCYAELSELSRLLAVSLQESGIKPNQLVAVYLQKSKYQAVATLGIMMSGGAYLPISTEEALERLHQILQLGVVDVVISSKALRGAIPANYRVIEIDDESSWGGRDTALLKINHNSDDLAYVIFTSGSTGTPKGVMIEHQAALNTIQDINQRYAINSWDRVYGLSNLNFDLSVYDLFGTLASGACLVLPKNEDRKEPSAWVKAIETDCVTVWNTVPALMEMLMDYAKSTGLGSELSSIRLVLMSGDWIPLSLAKVIKHRCGNDTEVISLGGATEASIWSILYPIKSISPNWKSIPYGRPMWNQQFYVFNQHLDPVPVGVVGELCIGGMGLARGYWRDKEKTDASFIIHPQTGEKLYRTGDLGRYGSDGVIDFLGRVDNQVKIRGYRIELGEIEAQLDRCNGIDRSVVIQQEGQLVAYLKCRNALDIKMLVVALKDKLPHYMLPDKFHQVERFTLSSNGKVDLKALANVFAMEEETDSNYEAPINESENIVAQIWSSTLDRAVISRHDNFFALGGHSLKALQVTSSLNNRFGCKINLKDLFNHPVLSDFSTIVAKRFDSNAVELDSTLAIKKLPPQVDYPLSHTQTRLWFMEKMVPDRRVYTVNALYRIYGELDLSRINQALFLVTQEQPMLRAVLVEKENGRQKLLSQYTPETAVVDWCAEFDANIDVSYTDELVKQFSESIAQEGYDFYSKPLWKSYIIKLSKHVNYLVFNFHHLIIDGVSLDIFISSVSDKYNSLVSNQVVHPKQLAYNYLDYAQSLVLPENKITLQNHLHYWESKLKDFKDYRLNLPTGKHRPAEFNFKGSNIEFQIASIEKTSQIDALAKKINCTRSTIFQGLYHLLLHYLSGQNDILTGQMLANRSHAGVENIIGYFSNTLVAKSSIQPFQRFDEYIQQLQRELLNDLSHQEVPFELLVDALSPVIDQSSSPIFQHMFVYQKLDNRCVLLNGLESTRLQHDSKSAKFDLSFFVEDMGDKINGKFEYYTEIFTEEILDNFISGLKVLLDSVLDNSHIILSKLNIISSDDKNKLDKWNKTSHHFNKKYDYLYSPFVEQVALTPSNIAIHAADGSYRYDELLAVSQSLAFKLQGLGAKPNKLIAIYLPKSKYQALATLGVMMSGAAYLPISAEEAPERLSQILEQGEVDIVLTCNELIELLEDSSRVIINLNDEADWFKKIDCPLTTYHKTTDLAYVIFTSGSTGIPKGVMIEHYSALNTIQDINQRYHLTASDQVYGLSSLNFDLSVYDLFGTLAVGATLVLPKLSERKEPAAWLKAIQEHGITIWNTVPALVQMLVDYVGSFNKPPMLNVIRLVLMSGDWIPLNLAEEIRRFSGNDTEVIGLGGATEASIWSILHPIKSISCSWKSIPYGRPMWNQQFYILNRHLDPVPVGVVGELCIGGEGLARGYWKDQAKTDASFIVHQVTGERLYRTGDLGRYRDDGIVEFLGRVDHQVKIRGYRIELGEIEAQLDQCDGIERSVVVERSSLLFAYVISNNELDEADVMRSLKTRVSSYMMPAALMQLDSFPLTVNGKIDRKQLPEINLATNEELYQEPKGEVENIVAEVWSKQLGIKNISRMGNFFALGGNSLKAVSVINMLRARLGYYAPLKLLFSSRTLAEFSDQINLFKQSSIQAVDTLMETGEL